MAVILQIIKKETKRPGVWKLNTSILKHENFQKTFTEFWKEWQNQKNKYLNINDWWESGKLYFKQLAIEYCTRKNQKITKKQNPLTTQILQEKAKLKPDIEKIEKYQQTLDEINNYKVQGKIIKSKEKLILEEEKPAKFFFLQEKQKQNKKTKNIRNEMGKLFQTNSEILHESKRFYMKTNNCEKNSK